LVYFLWSRIFTKSEEDKEWQERFEQTQQARESGEPVAPEANAPAGPDASPVASPGTSEDEINLEELASSIKKVEFDYDALRKKEKIRNPMAPLVGPYVAQAPVSGPDRGSAASAKEEAAVAAIRRNLLLSGIVWHPTHPIAIINNEVVPKGHTFPGEMFRTARSQTGILENGVFVERITQNSVILKYKDSEITLQLKER